MDVVYRATSKFAKKNRIAAVVWSKVYRAKLKKEKCFCGEKEVHAHHDDYSKPLEVMWLCRIHHKERHKFLKLKHV